MRSMRVNCVDNSSKVSCNTQRAMRRSNMSVNWVDNSSPSSLSSIELVLFKRIQLLKEAENKKLFSDTSRTEFQNFIKGLVIRTVEHALERKALCLLRIITDYYSMNSRTIAQSRITKSKFQVNPLRLGAFLNMPAVIVIAPLIRLC